MELKYIEKHFVAVGTVQEMVYEGRKEIPKSAGFRYSSEGEKPLPDYALWWTDDPSIAVGLVRYATDKAKAALRRMNDERGKVIEASRATTATLAVPAPDGLEYRPFQLAGIEFALGRENTLFGDEMGLGKTIQTIGVINSQGAIVKTLVICPATVKLNWKRELDKWLTRQPQSVEVAYANEPFPRADTVIINYDILAKFEAEIAAMKLDILVVDECHYVKNAKTQRSRQVKAIKAKRRLYLTGTPIVNRPIELWPIISQLDPATFSRFFDYAKRYCGAKHNGFGWDFGGASNLPELQNKLRSTIMVRRLKREVLKELPPKVRQVIELPANGAHKVVEAERKALAKSEDKLVALKTAVELAKASDDPEEYAKAVKALKTGFMVAFTEMAQVRHDTAVAKIPQVIEFVTQQVADDSKVVIFAHHHDVIDALVDAFMGNGVAKLDGRSSATQKQEAIDSFQNDPNIRVFVGNIQAAGIGITLTAASHVIFAELDWVPGNVTQAEDRLHRIGQEGSVLVQHLVLEGSIDANIAKTMVSKQAVIDKALDDTTAVVLAQEPTSPIPVVTASATKKAIHKEAETLTQAQVDAVHSALKYLTSLDSDRARVLNAAGFSKIDSDIGHSLASTARLTTRQAALGKRIVLKYHRQLDSGLVAAVKGEDA